MRIKFAEAGGDAARLFVVEDGVVDAGDRSDLAHGAGAEDFVGLVNFVLGDVSYFDGDVVLPAEVKHGEAGDAFGAGFGGGGFDEAIADEEDVGGVGLGEIAFGI